MSKEIVRMTIVYADGTMSIFVKGTDGKLSEERREK